MSILPLRMRRFLVADRCFHLREACGQRAKVLWCTLSGGTPTSSCRDTGAGVSASPASRQRGHFILWLSFSNRASTTVLFLANPPPSYTDPRNGRNSRQHRTGF